MSQTLISQITECIERTFNIEGKNLSERIIVFPCGDIGIQIISILRNVYSIEPAYLIDNYKCRYNPKIMQQSFLHSIPPEDYVLILASTNPDIYLTLRQYVLSIFPESNVLEFESNLRAYVNNPNIFFKTRVGRHSYGPICRDHDMIASIGSFCSFAYGVEVVTNHEMNLITTHPMVYAGVKYDGMDIDYAFFRHAPWYIEGIKPKAGVRRWRRSIIGNDVWLGHNVIVTNGSNIGNGVIAGAGSVVTKDVPDYAVVVGAPARIIRYRYNQKQIEALNKIAWWDWTDDEIRERFDDFYLPIEDFIKKYL